MKTNRKKPPTARQFALVMEAWAEGHLENPHNTREQNEPWATIYEMAHTVTSAKCQKNHPRWTETFWKKYDEVKSFWGGQNEK